MDLQLQLLFATAVTTGSIHFLHKIHHPMSDTRGVQGALVTCPQRSLPLSPTNRKVQGQEAYHRRHDLLEGGVKSTKALGDCSHHFFWIPSPQDNKKSHIYILNSSIYSNIQCKLCKSGVNNRLSVKKRIQNSMNNFKSQGRGIQKQISTQRHFFFLGKLYQKF